MVQELLPLLPKVPSDAAKLLWTVTTVGGIGGGFLWLMGAWFSRSLITLFLVAVGGVLGMQLPRWFAWPVQTWATAVGGAIVLGLLGFALHRLWAAVAFGLVLALGTAMGLWVGLAKGTAWSWPALQVSTTGPAVQEAVRALPAWAQAVWQNVPQVLQYWLPWACGTALAGGLVTGLIWKRLTTALLYSTLGVLMLMCVGLELLRHEYPAWLDQIPPEQWMQLSVLGGAVLVGWLVQFLLTKPAPAAKPAGGNGGGDKSDSKPKADGKGK